MSRWAKVPLASVAEVGSGSAFPIKYQGQTNEQYPFIKVSDMNLSGNERHILSWNNSVSEDARASLRARAFPPGSIVFPKVGAAIATNKKRILSRYSCVDNNVMAVAPIEEKIGSEFLYYLFLQKNISDFASKSDPPSMRKGPVEDWQIPLPSLEQQRWIVDLLDRTAGIRRLREQALTKARETISALFLSMFGDPASNPMEWPLIALGKVASVGSGSGFPKKEQGRTGEQFPFFKVSDMNKPGNEVYMRTANNSIDSATRTRLGATAFASGSIIFPKIGAAISTNKKRMLTVPSCIDNNIMAISPNTDTIVPEFLLQLLQFKNISDFANASNPPSMRKTDVEVWRIPLPPFRKQLEFCDRLSDLRSIVEQQVRALAVAQQLERSLMVRLLG